MISPFVFLLGEIFLKICSVSFLLCWLPSPKCAWTQKNGGNVYVFLASLPMVVCKIEGLPKGYLGKDETSVSAVPAHSAPCTPVMKITLGQSLKHDVANITF